MYANQKHTISAGTAAGCELPSLEDHQPLHLDPDSISASWSGVHRLAKENLSCVELLVQLGAASLS